MPNNNEAPINLNTLSNFELNKIFITEYCRGQMTTITFEPQRKICDITDIMESKCYFSTSSGSKQNFDYLEKASSHIGEYRLNIKHHGEGNNDVTVSSAEYPEVAPVTLPNGTYQKALCLFIIMMFDRYRKTYVVEATKD